MTTIQDIADHANVSKATVSRVINKTTKVNAGTRKAVMDAMTALKFQPNLVARSLAGGRSMTIGIVTQNIGSPFFDTVAQGVIKGLAGTEYSPIFTDGEWQKTTESKVIQTLLGRQVDGLVLIGGDMPVDELNVLRDRLPTIVVAREVGSWHDQCIFVDNVDGGYKATSHLLEFGHRDIACIHGSRNQPDAVQRYKGYRDALSDAAVDFDSDLVYYGDFSGQSGVLAVNSLLSRNVNFSAIFAANDMVAFGARLALHRHGIRVPDDVSIIGFDDQAEAAFMTPPLTTMRQPAAEMGTAAAAAIVNLISGIGCKLPGMSIELVHRESVTLIRG